MKTAINNDLLQSRAVSGQTLSASAFTLIELMISIALVVILILGVSQVFQYTTQAVGAGEAVTAAIRSSRSAQTAFTNDFTSMVGTGSGNNDAAFLIIASRSKFAYRDAKDEHSQGNLATLPSGSNYLYGLPNAALQDINGNGTSGESTVNGEIIHPDTYNYRNHRLDIVSFFARNQFPRQTGNPGTYVASQSSTEAFIWYGHLWLPDGTGSFYAGGDTTKATFPCSLTGPTNPNNYYGSQLVLGRQAILLTEKSIPGNVITDSSGTPQWFVDRATGTGPTAPDLTPLAAGSTFNTSATGSTTTDPGSSPYLYTSRLDLASTSIANFNQKLTNFSAAYPYTPLNSATWWWPTLSDGSVLRFQCNPFLNKPMTAANMALASPYFLGGCSQFIVEYAGDFVTQDNDPTHTNRVGHSQYGDIIGETLTPVPPQPANPNKNVNPDGQIDYFINSNNVKQTIWYGMPRNTSGQLTTCAGNASNPNPNGDVVPLRDWLQNVYDNTTGVMVIAPGSDTSAEFERYLPPLSEIADYHQNFSAGDAAGGYTCAWGPTSMHPKIMLIRITMTLEDPTGRLPNGQTFQYVFPVNPASTSKP